MATTIQISDKLQEELNKKKLSDRETYEEVIWDLMEDSIEISDQTKIELEQAREEIKNGKFVTISEAKRRFNL